MVSQSKVAASNELSLTPLRAAAAVGAVASVVLVLLGFSISFSYGVFSLIAAPIVPLAFVIVTDRVRCR